VVEQRGLIEVTLAAILSFARDLTATQQPRAFILADLDVFMYGLACTLIDQWPNVYLGIEAVTELQTFGTRRQRFDQLRPDALLDDQAAGCCAALPGRAERAPQDRLDSQVKIRVVHDDDRVLAAEFQADFLALPCSSRV